MKAKQVIVSVGITRNMGNYESLRLDYAITLDVGEEGNWPTVIDAARTACNIKLSADIADEIDWFRGVGG